MTDAFDTALRFAHVNDRKDPRAEELASRIIILFEKGERDPNKIARRATVNFRDAGGQLSFIWKKSDAWYRPMRGRGKD